MGHGPQNPTPTFHFVKIIFSHLILMGGSTIVQAFFFFFFFLYFILFFFIHDCPSTLCKLLFFSLDTHGARSTKSHPNFSLCENYIFSLDTHGAGSTIVQALCVNYLFFHLILMGHGPRLSKNFFIFIFYFLFFLSTIVQALCVNYYFFHLILMGHGPQNPTPTFHFVKIIFSHLILMGQDPRLSKHFV